MKVRMRTIASGPDFCAEAGEVVEVAAAHGKALVSGGFAEEVDEPGARSRPRAATARQRPGRGKPRQAAEPAEGDGDAGDGSGEANRAR
jgi:hypothetical protein